ncbi:MAG: hypothetical protein D6800_14800 [Candidatus Zixiibacteriota bacterium]|nr:MAG: hypothetical protein D6800_14800 [candidate division Zixibacteria bacterium]
MTNHPTRKELIDAATTPSNEVEQHVASCEECRTLFTLFKRYRIDGSPQLLNAPSEWIVRAKSIARPVSKLSRLATLVGEVIFDSWSTDLALGVRGADPDNRRMQLAAGDYKLDFHASRENNGWTLTARLHTERATSSDIVLLDRSQKVYPDEHKYMIWTAQRPPSTLRLRVNDTLIQFPRISWRIHKPRQNK